jgi:hypothetical protein
MFAALAVAAEGLQRTLTAIAATRESVSTAPAAISSRALAIVAKNLAAAGKVLMVEEKVGTRITRSLNASSAPAMHCSVSGARCMVTLQALAEYLMVSRG